MSMISGLIDRLRIHADLYDGKTQPSMNHELQRPSLAQELREAADTIWQLRDDLQRANAAVQDAEHDESMAWDRVRKAESENATLRELARKDMRLFDRIVDKISEMFDRIVELFSRMREDGSWRVVCTWPTLVR